MPAPLSPIFSSDQLHSKDLSSFSNYTSMLTRFETALASGEIYTAIWQRVIRQFKPLPHDSQIRAVNELMNKRPYVSDAQRWGVNDYWAAPGEFLQAGGDCEDYCIAKYLALRDLGHAEADMRIAIVDDLQLSLPHAILITKLMDGTEIVLDNQSPVAKPAHLVHRYDPIYSLNALGWWYHRKRS